MTITLISQAKGWARYNLGESKNIEGEDFVIEIFRVGPNTKNCGFDDDELENGWYWFCPADVENKVWSSPSEAAVGPFDSLNMALTDAQTTK